MEINEDNLIASICRDSFYQFFKEFWHTTTHEKLAENWHHKYICDEMQKIAERVFVGKKKEFDLVINIPPSTSKSTICTIMFPAWVWTRMPHAIILCSSCEARLATRLSRKCRDVINSDRYGELFPEIQIRRDQNGVEQFGNTLGGERLTFSTGSNPTGNHAHFLISDDPLKVLDGDSDAKKYEANLFQNEVLPSRKIDADVSVEILIMQRLAQDDPTGTMLERDNIRHILLSAESGDHVKPRKLLRHYNENGGLLDPVRLSNKTLDEKKKVLGSFGYACQYDNNPIPREGGFFKTSEIKASQTYPAKIVKMVRSWDTAGLKDRGCYTVGALIGIDFYGVYWILDVVRGQWDFSEREPIIKQTAVSDGKDVRIILERQGGSSGMEVVQATVRNLSGFTVEIDLPSGDKSERAKPFSSQVNAGNVKMFAGQWNRPLLEEMQYFPASKYKDQVDALSQGFAHLVDDGGFYGLL